MTDITIPRNLDLSHLPEGYWDSVVAFAQRTNQLSTFQTIINRLTNDIPNEVLLFKDFAPFSFEFVKRTETGEGLYNGGIIYHGPLEDGTHAETFSVQLVPTNSWQIHT